MLPTPFSELAESRTDLSVGTTPVDKIIGAVRTHFGDGHSHRSGVSRIGPCFASR